MISNIDIDIFPTHFVLPPREVISWWGVRRRSLLISKKCYYESQLEKAKLHVYSVNFRLNIWLGCVCHKECAVHCLWNLTWKYFPRILHQLAHLLRIAHFLLIAASEVPRLMLLEFYRQEECTTLRAYISQKTKKKIGFQYHRNLITRMQSPQQAQIICFCTDIRSFSVLYRILEPP